MRQKGYLRHRRLGVPPPQQSGDESPPKRYYSGSANHTCTADSLHHEGGYAWKRVKRRGAEARRARAFVMDSCVLRVPGVWQFLHPSNGRGRVRGDSFLRFGVGRSALDVRCSNFGARILVQGASQHPSPGADFGLAAGTPPARPAARTPQPRRSHAAATPQPRRSHAAATTRAVSWSGSRDDRPPPTRHPITTDKKIFCSFVGAWKRIPLPRRVFASSQCLDQPPTSSEAPRVIPVLPS